MKRRRNYLPLWALLVAALVAIACVSAFGPVRIGGYEMKDSGLAGALIGQQTGPELVTAGNDTLAQATVTAAPEPVPVDTAAKTILFIGDSMLDGLYPRLAAYASHNGHTLYAVIWYSSTSEKWGTSGRLKSYINRLSPDYIFICLGANELFVKNIADKRDAYVKTIIDEAGDIPYLWIGPPNWKPDTGINDLIAANAAPGTFFLSDGMSFERGKDGAHPTRTSAAQWMDSVVRWMPAHHPHPIRLDVPDASSGRARRVFVHQPNE